MSESKHAAKQIVSTDAAPAAIGPYSQGVRAGGFVFTAGQLPIDPDTGEIVSGGIEAQTRRVLENLKAILEEAGTGLDAVVKATVFITDLADFAAMNAVYGTYFQERPPARSTVEITGLAKGALVEIEAVALL